MKKSFDVKGLSLVLLAVAIVMATAAFQTKPVKARTTATDTVPDHGKKVRDIDDALEELERSKAEVDRSMKEIDFSKIEAQVKEATKNIHLDTEKMKAQLDEAMKQVDAAKIQAEVQKSLQQAEAARMKAEIDKAMKDVDMEKMKANIEASVAKVDWDKMHQEIEKAKSVDFAKIEADLKKMKPEIEKSMKAAHASIEKAKKELTQYKGLIDGLDKDGVMHKEDNYTIEYKKGALTVNGKTQPAEVVNKYPFLKGHKDFTIKKTGDDFTVNND